MTADKMIVFGAYAASILMFFNFTSSFIFWFWLEINMMVFLALMLSDKYKVNELDGFSQCLYYFIIQSLCSVFLLMCFSMETFLGKDPLVLVLMVFKMGISPLHFWTFKICSYISISSMFFLLNIQKIPLIMFIMAYSSKMAILAVLFNILGGSILISYSNSLVDFLVSSSLCFFSWLIFIFMWSIMGFFLFFFKYMSLNLIMLNLKKFCNHYDYNTLSSVKLLILTVFMMGLPPFAYFYYKYYIISLLYNFSSGLLCLIVWAFSFLCLVCYFNFFLFLISKVQPLYATYQSLKTSEFILILFMLFQMVLTF